MFKEIKPMTGTCKEYKQNQGLSFETFLVEEAEQSEFPFEIF